MKKSNSLLIVIFLIALVLRLAVLLPQYSGDVKNHLAWGIGFVTNPNGLFSRHFPGFNDINYPPVIIMIFGLAETLFRFFKNTAESLNTSLSFFPSFLVPFFNWENTHIAFYKLPGLFCDLGIGALIYLIAKRSQKKPLIPAILYLFNPAVIYTSSVWGQTESITIFFLVLSLYFGTKSKTKDFYYSMLAFTISVLSKQTALWFLPFYLILWLKPLKIQKFVVGAIISLVTFFVFYLPFGLWPIQAISSYLSTLSGSTTLAADAVWNIWYFIFPVGTQDSISLGIFSLRTFSIIILGISLLYLVLSSLKNYSHHKLLRNLFIWSLLVFFIQTRVHERHLAFAVAFFWLAYLPNLATISAFITLSAFHLFNLYFTLRLPFI